jgi:type I restriction enzyme M protein
MLDQQTKKRIDDCRNILVGKITDPKSQVEQITIALIYKFMDDMDTEAVEMGGVPTYFVGEYERYSWKNIFSPRIGGDEMLQLYGEGMVKMNQNPNLPQLFRDIFKNAYLPYRDPETLKLFLKTINDFKYDHSEKLGDAFEYLLSVLGSQGDAGQFRTPRHIIEFIVKIIDPKKNETMFDPACGTSGFLISGYKHILNSNTNKIIGDKLTPDERKKLMNNITGYDISPDMVRLSLVNLFLHGFTNPKVFEYDSLTSEDRWNEYFDVALANPPFMSPKGGIRPHKRFGIESNRAEVLFVDYMMEHLTPKGRAGIVVPEGIIFQSGTAYKSLRRTMVEKYLVGVISLPSGVFNPYSGVKTSIIVLDRELSQKTDKIFFAKVENDGYDLGAQRREIDKTDLPAFTEEITSYLNGLRNGKEVECKKLNFVTKEKILESNDVGLSYDRYSTGNSLTTEYEKIHLGNKDYFEIVSGGTPNTVIDEYWNGTIPWISLVDLPQDDMISIIKTTKRTITHLGLKNSSAKIIPRGSVVVSTRATIGRVGITEIELCTNQGFKNIIIKDTNKVNPIYLSYVVTLLTPRMLELSSGGTFKEISKSNFETLEIPLPPIEVQEEIVRGIEKINLENKDLEKKISENKDEIQTIINKIWGK